MEEVPDFEHEACQIASLLHNLSVALLDDWSFFNDAVQCEGQNCGND